MSEKHWKLVNYIRDYYQKFWNRTDGKKALQGVRFKVERNL